MFSLLLLLLSNFIASAEPTRLIGADACEHFYRALGEPVEVSRGPAGPRLVLPPLETTRALESIPELRVASYNVQGLQSFLGEYHRLSSGEFERVRPQEWKPARAREALAAELLSKDPDMIFLEEVKGFGSLVEFNQQYLGRAYRPIVLKGNDPYGTEIGILVKRDLPLEVEVQSNARTLHLDPVKRAATVLFNRDAPLVTLRKPGEARPLFAVVGTHLKSQRDSFRGMSSEAKRAAQVKGSLNIIDGLHAQWPGLPVFMTGDFNADLRGAREFEPLWRGGMRDSFDFGPRPLPPSARTTQTFHPRSLEGEPTKPAVRGQLDAILMDKEAANLRLVKDSGIVPHLDDFGRPRPIPRTFAERRRNPSDHFMVFGAFDFQKILKAWRQAGGRN